MSQHPDPRIQLFSRQQIAEITQVDDSTLNYWMRENVLRADSGGGGKGQHRRFRFAEVNLALIFNQLRTFGISITALRSLADRFHSALDYMGGLGINPRVDSDLARIMDVRRGSRAETSEIFPADVIMMADSLDREEYEQNSVYWFIATTYNTQLPNDEPEEFFVTSPTYFYRDAAGDWVASDNDSNLINQTFSFIGVDIEHLSALAWRRYGV